MKRLEAQANIHLRTLIIKCAQTSAVWRERKRNELINTMNKNMGM